MKKRVLFIVLVLISWFSQTQVFASSGLSFDGTTQNIVIPQSSFRSVMMWVYLPTTAKTGQFEYILDGRLMDDYSLFFATYTGGISNVYIDGVSTADRAVAKIPHDRWVHVYIEMSSLFTRPLHLFGRWNNTEYLAGSADEISLWNRTLSEQEVQSYMYQRPACSATGLLAYYSCDNVSSASLVNDCNSATLTATITGYSASQIITSPSWLKVSSLGLTSVGLTWQSISSASSYKIEYSTNADFSSSQQVTASGSSYTVSNLLQATKYYFRVTALGIAGTNYDNVLNATTKQFSVSPESLTIGASLNSTATVSLSADMPWTASSAASWLSVNPLSANLGLKTITIKSTEENTSSVSRSANITFSSSEKTLTVLVTQAAGATQFSITNKTLALKSSVASTQIKANVAWKAYSLNSWLRLSTLSTSSFATIDSLLSSSSKALTVSDLYFIAQKNETLQSRIAKVVVEHGNNRDTISISQDAGAPILQVNNDSLLCDKLVTSTQIRSNMNWTATAPPDSWLRVALSSSSDFAAATATLSFESATPTTKELFFVAQTNVSSVPRSATVKVVAALARDSVVVTQAAAPALLQISPLALYKTKSKSFIDSIVLNGNVSWNAKTVQPWLRVSLSNKLSFEQASASVSVKTSSPASNTVYVYASSNVSIKSRTGIIQIFADGVGAKSVVVSQAPALAVDSAKIAIFSNFVMVLDSVSKKFYFKDYFINNTDNDLVCSIKSVYPDIVYPSVNTESFGLIPYNIGSTTLVITASTNDGLTVSYSFTVNVVKQICQLKLDTKIIHPSCARAINGKIELLASQGAKPYYYRWSNTSSDSILHNASAGRYSVVLRDSLGCTLSKDFELIAPSALRVSAQYQAPSCGNTDGSIRLAVSGGVAPYKYLWNDSTKADSLVNQKSGTFSAIITDANGCVQRNSYVLGTQLPAIFIDSVKPSACNAPQGKVWTHAEGGVEPLQFKWSDNSVDINRKSLKPGSYSLSVSDAAGCEAVAMVQIPSITFAQPRIALVTVNKKGENLVVWNKESTEAIEKYTIYVEGERAGEYVPIGSKKYADTSVFVDVNANNQALSYRYKISASDYCGNESALSPEHRTMLLRKYRGLQNDIQLAWDAYEGVEYYTYTVYRVSKSKPMPEAIRRISANNQSFNDLTPPADVMSYFVAIDLPNEINPLKTKTDTGPFSQSFSNMSEASLVDLHDTKEADDTEVSLVPNPAKGIVIINFAHSKAASITLVDLLGHQLFSTQGVGSVTIDCSAYTAGMYLVHIKTADGTTTHRLMIE